MHSRLILAMLLMMLMTGVAIAAQDVFQYESWPFEGMPYFEVVKDKIELHESAMSKSPVVATLMLKRGAVMSFDFGVKELIKRRKEYGGKIFGIKNNAKIYSDLILGKSIQITIKPGILRARADGGAWGFSFKKGDVIEDLVYVGEGVCVYRYAGKVTKDVPCLYNEIGDGTLVQESQPVTEWWVTVVENGKTIGWLEIDGSSPLNMIDTIN
ncbi:MAG: hypothetical protein HZC48_05865 [Nitrospirae bacterium]|nr:hypothetical protein [Nitrospirota bacterium]